MVQVRRVGRDCAKDEEQVRNDPGMGAKGCLQERGDPNLELLASTRLQSIRACKSLFREEFARYVRRRHPVGRFLEVEPGMYEDTG